MVWLLARSACTCAKSDSPKPLLMFDSVSTQEAIQTRSPPSDPLVRWYRGLGRPVRLAPIYVWTGGGRMELAGRVALVTGGSGDLGSAICRALARSKMDVAVTYVGERERAEHVVAEVEGGGCRAWGVQL